MNQTEPMMPLSGPGASRTSEMEASAEHGLVPLPEYPRLRLHRQFHSHLLPADRDLVVYLPEPYESDPNRSFPVLYLQDGQNLFDGHTSYIPGRTWGVQETVDRLIAAGEIEPLIVVGIYNTGESRLVEYTPTRNPRMGGGKASLYGRMLMEEIAPFIGSRYRTLAGPQNTGVGGSSLGGLLALYLGLEHQDWFGKLAILSPSIWWDHKSILAFVNQAHPKPGTRMWLDTGTAEGKRTLRDADLLHSCCCDEDG